MNKKIKWKGKKVLYFKWKEYIGFFPVKEGVVLKETENEILIKFKIFKRWSFKHDPYKIKLEEKEVGFCKLII